MADKNTALSQRPLILLLGGSGSGKSTVARELETTYGMKQVASYTTRKPRFEGEPGHTFISQNEFAVLMNSNQLVAYTEISGAQYGATKEQVDDADIYVIDAAGALHMQELYHTDRPIYFILLNISEEERIKRMHERGTEDEVAARRDFDYDAYRKSCEAGMRFENFDVVCNDVLEWCVQDIAEIVGL